MFCFLVDLTITFFKTTAVFCLFVSIAKLFSFACVQVNSKGELDMEDITCTDAEKIIIFSVS